MSNLFKPGYGDAIREYCENDALALQQMYNTNYLMQKENSMNREYISVIVDDNPTVIFKRNIIAVSKENDRHTVIICVSGKTFYTKEDYASVVKKIIG